MNLQKALREDKERINRELMDEATMENGYDIDILKKKVQLLEMADRLERAFLKNIFKEYCKFDEEKSKLMG